MSLSSLFDISHPTDFLRSALNMLSEYEQAKEDNDRPKMVSYFALTSTPHPQHDPSAFGSALISGTPA
jgi:hypothetical protein